MRPVFGFFSVEIEGCRAALRGVPRSFEASSYGVQIIVETYNNGSPTPEFNNAGQIFNHDFYWESISPEKRETPHAKHESASLNVSPAAAAGSHHLMKLKCTSTIVKTTPCCTM